MNRKLIRPLLVLALLIAIMTLAATAALAEERLTSALEPVELAQAGLDRNAAWVSQLGGSISAVATRGNRAYVAAGPRVVILDISNPAAPVEIGRSPLLPHVVNDLVVYGDFVYLADTMGLRIMDIIDPTAPALRGSRSTSFEPAAIAVEGDYAYVTAANYVYVFHILEPDQPQQVNMQSLTGFSYGVGIDTLGDFAYVANESAGLRVINIMDPENLVMVSRYFELIDARDVVVTGTHAFVADSAGLHIVDVSDPEHPQRTGTLDTPGLPMAIAITAQYAYLADSQSGLFIADINSLTSPQQAGRYTDITGFATDVALSNGQALLVTESALHIVDVSAPSTPMASNRYPSPLSTAYGVVSRDNRAYVASGESGLAIVDLTDPAAPVMLGQATGIGDATAVAIDGDTACVASGFDGLYTVHIGDPGAPVMLGHWDTPGEAESYDVAIKGDLAFLAEQPDWGADPLVGGGLRVVDMSNRSDPQPIGYCDTREEGQAVAVRGDYAYLAVGYYSDDLGEQVGGLSVIDISNPNGPFEVGFALLTGEAHGVAIQWPYAYVASDRGLHAVNISEATDPVVVDELVVPAYDVAVEAGYAYVASTNLTLVDIQDPTDLLKHGQFSTPGRAAGVAVSGEYVLIADVAGGLTIVKPIKPLSIYVPNLMRSP